MNKSAFLFMVFFIIGHGFGREHYRYNANTDFLQHESGVKPTEPKQNAASQPTQVLSLSPQYNSQADSKRDYVANFPQLKPTAHTLTPTTFPTRPQSQTNTGGKRDYVSPQHTTTKPASNNHQSTSNVKDLVNFYENQNNGQTLPKIPSYSSIVQGTVNKNTPTFGPNYSTTKITLQTTPKSPTMPTKPLSFSSVVAGHNKPSTAGSTTIKPVNVQTSRPGTPSLPSSILNNNKNQNGGSKVTDAELQTLSEELLRKDVNNAAKYVNINYQEKTTSLSKEDKASQPLLTVAPEAWNIPTIQKFIPLLDNYERDTLINEYVTPQERNEENAFMDAVMSTSVIRHLMNFFKDKGYVTPDPRQQRDFLKQLWFSLYSRGKGKISSSGFEHVFVSELKNGEVSGLHNWIYFTKEETANRMNYLGYLKYLQLDDKGVVMKLHFSQLGTDKPVDSMFIGPSPELEMALYTLCFVTRSDNDCNIKLANKDVNIITHKFRYRSKDLIGSAYPQI